MATSAEGIVENAVTFTGMVRSRLIRIVLLNHDDQPIPNTKCKVTFQDGQTMSIESDDEGVIEFIRKAQGEFDVELLEDTSTEGSEGEG